MLNFAEFKFIQIALNYWGVELYY